MAIFDKANFEITTENGVSSFTYTDKDAYKNGTDIPFKVLKEVGDYNAEYVREASQLSFELAKEHGKKHKDVNEIVFKYPYSSSGRGSIGVEVLRTKNVRIPSTGEVTTRSDMKIIVKDPNSKFPEATLKDFNKQLTEVLCS